MNGNEARPVMCACGHTAESHSAEGCYGCAGPQPCNVIPEVAWGFYE